MYIETGHRSIHCESTITFKCDPDGLGIEGIDAPILNFC